ncbi:hypothetical protein TNCV_2705131 [Trichonephila clavipes]|nr:hypothetical protein TNCV_2705131 [Trichonephila clavipes]
MEMFSVSERSGERVDQGISPIPSVSSTGITRPQWAPYQVGCSTVAARLSVEGCRSNERCADRQFVLLQK